MEKEKCLDKNCPIHGTVKTRGRSFVGRVRSAKMQRTAIIEFERMYHLPKYERYERRRTRLRVHNPDCIMAKEGEMVRVIECRPLSKTKHFVIVKKIEKKEK